MAISKHLRVCIFIPVCRTYFRYFRVDFEKNCPFWSEYGQCNSESCSVCACDDGEVPEALQAELAREAEGNVAEQAAVVPSGITSVSVEEEFGWISQGRTPDSGDTSLSAPPLDHEKNELMAHISAQEEGGYLTGATKKRYK